MDHDSPSAVFKEQLLKGPTGLLRPPPALLSPADRYFLWLQICVTMDPKFAANAWNYYNENEDNLADLLNTAWGTQQFEDVRRRVHEAFRPVIIPVLRRGLDDGDIEIEQGKSVVDAWAVPYQLDSHKILYATINTMRAEAVRKDCPDYSNNVSIVQSSGTGKSRMVDEQATLVVTCPFNLRHDDNSSYFAYPKPDRSIRDCLLTMQDSATDVKIGYHLFFMCLFRKISAHFNAIQGKIPRQKMATDWKNHLRGQMRDKFYKDLTRDINAEKTKGYTLDSTIDKASEGIRSLIKIIKEHTSDGNDHNVQLVIYFDEAHTLFKTAKNNDPLFFILLSVLNAYRKEPLFVIFLSTHLGPARSQLFTSTLPITKISFDCAPRECLPVQPYALTIADITQVPFMARFGRPLYWSMLSTLKGIRLERTSNALLDITRAKLTNNRTDISPDNARRPDTLLAQLAVTDVRLCLQYAQQTSHNNVMTIQANLVASHMRIAYHIPRHRKWFRSGYSSEPILAEAAARQLKMWRMTSPTALIDPLLSHTYAGLLDLGERGELIARALLVEAYDAAVARTYAEMKDKPTLFSGGWCKAIHFIEALFQKDYAAAILDSHPDNTIGSTLREALEESIVHLTQWVKATDDHVVTTVAMVAAFTRGMAFICRNGQPQIDLLIPILLSNTTIGEKHMSAFLIQVKRRKGSGIYPISAETLGFFKYPNATKHDKRPYISLIMDLGVRVTLPNYAQLPAVDVISKAQKMARLRQVGASSIETQIPPRKTESKERGKGKTPDNTIPGVTKTASTEVEVNTHPLPSTRIPTKDQPRRYSIHAFGCSDTVYKVIRPEDRQKWQTLLVDEFLADHPRKETLAQVRRLKPFFTLGKECYHWFNDPSLNLDPPPAVPHEADQTAVFIGEYLDEGEEDANADAEISSPMVVNQSSEQDDAFNEQPQLDQDAEENIEMVE